MRGLQPWPGAQTVFRGVPLLIWKSRVAAAPAIASGTGAPGTILSLRPLAVAAGDGALELLEVQLEGRKRMAAADFVNGQRWTGNDSLGEGPS